MIKNLGLVKAIYVNTLPPSNTDLLWLDTLNSVFKYFNSSLSTWDILGQPPKFINDTAATAAGLGEGNIYYNTSTKKFRCKENVTWSNLV